MHAYPRTPGHPGSYPEVASHIPVLYTIFTWSIIDDIYEFGAGYYSTLFLAACGLKYGCWMWTGENNELWRPQPLFPHHTVLPAHDIIPVDRGTPRDLAFVDCEAELRAPILRKLTDHTRIGMVVAHDTQPLLDKSYGMSAELIRWPNGVVVRCPYSGIETTVVWRDGPRHILRAALEQLNDSAEAHLGRWEMARETVGLMGLPLTGW
jgi:hypothetical protein